MFGCTTVAATYDVPSSDAPVEIPLLPFELTSSLSGFGHVMYGENAALMAKMKLFWNAAELGVTVISAAMPFYDTMEACGKNVELAVDAATKGVTDPALIEQLSNDAILAHKYNCDAAKKADTLDAATDLLGYLIKYKKVFKPLKAGKKPLIRLLKAAKKDAEILQELTDNYGNIVHHW